MIYSALGEAVKMCSTAGRFGGKMEVELSDGGFRG
jgi:hypothetical protein